ncbi:MAG: acetyl-CoA carboxylase biotin carboxylase subunit [Pseudomonadota bacterium]
MTQSRRPHQKSVLIANRGEIACRIIDSARGMGLWTIAVYSDADAQSRHVRLADEVYPIGPAPSPQSYLNIDALSAAISRSGADFVHPGYGFLSENAAFARACETLGTQFVGPPVEAIATMADKAQAKTRMEEMGVPCIPGYRGADQSNETLIREAKAIGLPVMIKAAAGGGGRGMRLVTAPSDLADALAAARLEAQNAFGNDHLLLEKAVIDARHVEIQILADCHGTVLHLGERDCSAQRRHQKVVEEAPCPVMTPTLRAAMGAAAVKAAQAVAYVGAGTVEFLLDSAGNFYFLEMNTRLQVEHPVTELVTGLDLVAEQIRIAQGHALTRTQEDIALRGHAIEVRLYAEDPSQDFLPQSGGILDWHAPSGDGVRVDHAITSPGTVTPYYDPMLAKIIAHGPTREEARQRLSRALEETVLHGVITNRSYLLDVLDSDVFAKGAVTTTFLETTFVPGDGAKPEPAEIALAAMLVYLQRQAGAMARARTVPGALSGWSNTAPLPTPLKLRPTPSGDGDDRAVEITPLGRDLYQVAIADTVLPTEVIQYTHDRVTLRLCENRLTAHYHFTGDALEPSALSLALPRKTLTFDIGQATQTGVAKDAGDGQILAPMHGQMTALSIAPGDSVTEGQSLGTLEAMKMQHTLTADCAGTISEVNAIVGAQVSLGDILFVIDPATDDTL